MTLYLPEEQNAVRYTHIIARVESGDPMRLERDIRRVVYEEAPTLAVAPMLTLETGNAYLTRTPLRAMWLLGVFAALALVLAGVGVHGVIAYTTSQRTREMGIRMALGAQPRATLRPGNSQALRLATIGAAIGLAGAYAATRLVETLLLFGFWNRCGDLRGAIAVLVAVAAISSFTPRCEPRASIQP